MSATYRYVTDTAYFKALMERYYRQRIWAIRPWGQFAILTAPLGLAFIYAWGTNASWTTGAGFAFSGMILLSVVCVVAIKVAVLSRLRRGPTANGQITATISEEQLHFVGPRTESTYQWSAYPRSVRYSDGILLLRPGVICWLPDSALTNSTADAATALVRTHTKFRMVA